MPRHDRSENTAVDLVNDRSQIDAVRDHIVESVQRLGYPPASAFAIRLAFEEAVSNAFRHGHRSLPPATPVNVSFSIGPDRVEIAVHDRGPGFDPRAIPDPTSESNIELPSGRGIMLIRAYMSQVDFNAAGNQVRMVYRRPAGDRAR